MKYIELFENFEILNEGRYNTFVSELTQIMMYHVKKSINKKKYTTKFNIENLSPDNIEFEIQLTIKRKQDMPFPIDISAYMSIDPKNVIEYKINICKYKNKPESSLYTLLVAEIKDSVRHEIEHFTQQGIHKLKGKEKSTLGLKVRSNAELRKKMDKYFLLRDEIPAYVHGLYAKTKYNKSNLDEEMLNYIKDFNLSKIETRKVMKAWLTFAKRMLPHASYSENISQWLPKNESNNFSYEHKYKEGDYILLNMDRLIKRYTNTHPIEEFAQIEEVTKNPLFPYKILSLIIEWKDKIQFYLQEPDILRLLTPEEINEYEIKKSSKKYNL